MSEPGYAFDFENGRLKIYKGEPVVKISVDLWDMLADGAMAPYVTIDGDVLRFDANGHKVIYRIREKVPMEPGDNRAEPITRRTPYAYVAEWPD